MWQTGQKTYKIKETTTTTTFAMSTVIKGNKLIFRAKRKEKWHLETTLLHAPVRFFEERISLPVELVRWKDINNVFSAGTPGDSGRRAETVTKTSTWTSSCSSNIDQTCRTSSWRRRRCYTWGTRCLEVPRKLLEGSAAGWDVVWGRRYLIAM